MIKNEVFERSFCKNDRRILAFATPKTPRKVERELGISKLNLLELVEQNVVRLLNPQARKGRLYLLTDYARQRFGLNVEHRKNTKNCDNYYWELVGWIVASPRQRMSVLRTIGLDCVRRTSEELRQRAVRFNDKFTRISIKEILKELIAESLVETKLIDRKRYYWISEKGVIINQQVQEFLDN